MSKIEEMIEALLGREGGYVNHAHDRGGETIWGITVGTARQHGYHASMRHMTREQAKDIYRAAYWTKPGFHLIEKIYPRVADEMFDTGVNMGQSIPGRFLQRALNAFIDARLAQDGMIGPATLSALRSFKQGRGPAGEEVLVRALDAMQGERYLTLVERRTKNRSFAYGWFAHRIGNA